MALVAKQRSAPRKCLMLVNTWPPFMVNLSITSLVPQNTRKKRKTQNFTNFSPNISPTSPRLGAARSTRSGVMDIISSEFWKSCENPLCAFRLVDSQVALPRQEHIYENHHTGRTLTQAPIWMFFFSVHEVSKKHQGPNVVKTSCSGLRECR